MKKKLLVPLVFSILLVGCINKNPDQERIDELANIFERHYAEKIVQFENENKIASKVDVVFLGDSITENYDVKKYYSEFNVLNRGIGGDTTIGVETRLGVSAYEVDPKVLVMLIGVNNIDTMFDNYQNILNSLKTNIPNTKVILLSLTPMTNNFASRNIKAIANNIEIKKMAKENEFSYIDIYTPLLDSSTNELNRNYTIDGLHLNLNGYEVVTSKVKPIIEKYIS